MENNVPTSENVVIDPLSELTTYFDNPPSPEQMSKLNEIILAAQTEQRENPSEDPSQDPDAKDIFLTGIKDTKEEIKINYPESYGLLPLYVQNYENMTPEEQTKKSSDIKENDDPIILDYFIVNTEKCNTDTGDGCQYKCIFLKKDGSITGFVTGPSPLMKNGPIPYKPVYENGIVKYEIKKSWEGGRKSLKKSYYKRNKKTYRKKRRNKKSSRKSRRRHSLHK
jgi:hypothetical protein